MSYVIVIGCGSFEVKFYNETRRFLEDTATFYQVGVETYDFFEREARVSCLSPLPDSQSMSMMPTSIWL